MASTLALSSIALRKHCDQFLNLPMSLAELSRTPILRTPLLEMKPTLTTFWKPRDRSLALPEILAQLSESPPPEKTLTPTPPSTVLWKPCG